MKTYTAIVVLSLFVLIGVVKTASSQSIDKVCSYDDLNDSTNHSPDDSMSCLFPFPIYYPGWGYLRVDTDKPLTYGEMEIVKQQVDTLYTSEYDSTFNVQDFYKQPETYIPIPALFTGILPDTIGKNVIIKEFVKLELWNNWEKFSFTEDQKFTFTQQLIPDWLPIYGGEMKVSGGSVGLSTNEEIPIKIFYISFPWGMKELAKKTVDLKVNFSGSIAIKVIPSLTDFSSVKLIVEPAINLNVGYKNFTLVSGSYAAACELMVSQTPPPGDSGLTVVWNYQDLYLTLLPFTLKGDGIIPTPFDKNVDYTGVMDTLWMDWFYIRTHPGVYTIGDNMLMVDPGGNVTIYKIIPSNVSANSYGSFYESKDFPVEIKDTGKTVNLNNVDLNNAEEVHRLQNWLDIGPLDTDNPIGLRINQNGFNGLIDNEGYLKYYGPDPKWWESIKALGVGQYQTDNGITFFNFGNGYIDLAVTDKTGRTSLVLVNLNGTNPEVEINALLAGMGIDLNSLGNHPRIKYISDDNPRSTHIIEYGDFFFGAWFQTLFAEEQELWMRNGWDSDVQGLYQMYLRGYAEESGGLFEPDYAQMLTQILKITEWDRTWGPGNANLPGGMPERDLSEEENYLHQYFMKYVAPVIIESYCGLVPASVVEKVTSFPYDEALAYIEAYLATLSGREGREISLQSTIKRLTIEKEAVKNGKIDVCYGISPFAECPPVVDNYLDNLEERIEKFCMQLKELRAQPWTSEEVQQHALRWYKEHFQITVLENQVPSLVERKPENLSVSQFIDFRKAQDSAIENTIKGAIKVIKVGHVYELYSFTLCDPNSQGSTEIGELLEENKAKIINELSKDVEKRIKLLGSLNNIKNHKDLSQVVPGYTDLMELEGEWGQIIYLKEKVLPLLKGEAPILGIYTTCKDQSLPMGADAKACCDNPSDCVDSNGHCVSSGAISLDSFGIMEYHCENGDWKSVETEVKKINVQCAGVEKDEMQSGRYIFEDTPVGDSRTATCMIYNLGDTVVDVAGNPLNGAPAFRFVRSPLTPILPRRLMPFEIAFTPTRAGQQTATVTIMTDVGEEEVTFIGTSLGAEISFMGWKDEMQDCYAPDGQCNCTNIPDNPNDQQYCDTKAQCVYKNTCYKPGDIIVWDDRNSRLMCVKYKDTAAWIDPDCGDGDRSAADPIGQYCSGDGYFNKEWFGLTKEDKTQFEKGTNPGCCGDDLNEQYQNHTEIMGVKAVACCNAETDCVDFTGKCIKGNDEETSFFNATNYECYKDGDWVKADQQPTVTLIAPDDGGTAAAPVELRWQSSAPDFPGFVEYEVTVVDDAGVRQNYRTKDLSLSVALWSATKYYWQVRAIFTQPNPETGKEEEVSGPWSVTWRFFVATAAPTPTVTPTPTLTPTPTPTPTGSIPQPEINIRRQGGATVPHGGTYGFGPVNVNQSTSASFVVENLGDAVLTLTGTPWVQITGSPVFTVVHEPSSTIAAMSSDPSPLVLGFVPTAPGTYTATVTIFNNDADENPYSFTLTGTGAETIPTPTVTITNPPDNSSGGNSVTITYCTNQDGVLRFYADGGIVSTTGNSAGCYPYTFNALADGLRTLRVELESHEQVGFDEIQYTVNPVSIPTPEINVKGPNGVDIPNGGTYDFGTMTKDETKTFTFTIQNLGNADLQLTGTPLVELLGPDVTVIYAFAVTQAPVTPITPSPGNTSTFAIEVTTPGIKTYSATVVILSNDADEGFYTFTSTGEAVGPTPSGTTVQCDIYDFGTRAVGSSSTATCTIQNNSSVPLDIAGIPLDGGAGAFSFAQLPSTPVNPGESTIFTVAFAPIEAGQHTATVSIYTDAGEELTIIFTGIGEAIAPTPTETTIAKVAPVPPPLKIMAVSDPAHGTAVVNDNGTPDDPTDDYIVYTPDAGFTGTDSYTYTICAISDPSNCSTATVTVTVLPAPTPTPTSTPTP